MDNLKTLRPSSGSDARPPAGLPNSQDERLSERDAGRLRRLEGEVETGLKATIKAGAALSIIRDDKLYREAFPSFELYVRARFGISRAHAYRLIDAEKTLRRMSPTGDISFSPQMSRSGLVPISERQFRLLKRLDDKQLGQIHQWVLRRGGYRRVSSEWLQEEIAKLLAAAEAKSDAERALEARRLRYERELDAQREYDDDVARLGPNTWVRRPVSAEAVRLTDVLEKMRWALKQIRESAEKIEAIDGELPGLHVGALVREANPSEVMGDLDPDEFRSALDLAQRALASLHGHLGESDSAQQAA